VTEISTPVGGVSTTDSYGYPANSNRLVQITRGAATIAALTYDNAGGNMLSNSRAGSAATYTYNNRNRLATATVGAVSYAYTYNGREQLAIRQQTTAPVSTTHFIHDLFGNVLAETSGLAAGTVREYIWLPETEIAPTREANAQVDRPLAVVNAVGTASVAIWNVSVDHLNRPVLMTNSLKGPVWTAVWQPWGGAHSITGAGVFDARLPGQWYQTETGLHYNWHRSYDPAVGRYTQPDPLGFVDGPSVYGYAKGRPLSGVDFDGRFSGNMAPPGLVRPSLNRPMPFIGPLPPPGSFYPYTPPTSAGPFGDPAHDDHDEYTDICKQPTPLGLDPCQKAAWEYQKLKLCVQKRERWINTYKQKLRRDGTFADHAGELRNYRAAEDNALNNYNKYCRHKYTPTASCPVR
jgi:RHS repeat-associated protein